MNVGRDVQRLVELSKISSFYWRAYTVKTKELGGG